MNPKFKPSPKAVSLKKLCPSVPKKRKLLTPNGGNVKSLILIENN